MTIDLILINLMMMIVFLTGCPVSSTIHPPSLPTFDEVYYINVCAAVINVLKLAHTHIYICHCSWQCCSCEVLENSLYPDLVVSVLCDVPHPGQSLVSALFDDLQVPYLDARRREVRDLELDSNRWLSLLFLRLHAR